MKVVRALSLGLALALAACAGTSEPDDVATHEAALGAEPRAAGIEEGSLDEEGVLAAANDRAVSAGVLAAAGVPGDAATAIEAARTDATGAPRWFESVDDLDAVPGTDADVFRKLVAYARGSGHTEAEGFDALDAVRIRIDDAGGRPTSDRVSVEAGFDGRSPDQTVTLVRSRLRGTIHASNERFFRETVLATQKSFTIGLNNLFVPTSPPGVFVRGLRAERLTLLGTMSALNPTVLVAERSGATTYYARDGATYTPIEPPSYPIIVRARIRLEDGETTPPGVRVHYPSWKANVLAGPTGRVLEPGED